MKKTKRKYTAEFKSKVALEAIRGRESIAELAKRFGVHASLVHSWKRMVMKSAPVIMETGGNIVQDEEELRKAREREVARLTLENEWLQKVLQRLSVSERKAAVINGGSRLPLIRQVALLNVARSAVYYQRKHATSMEEESRVAN